MVKPLKWSDFIESGSYGTFIRTSIPLNLTLDGGFLTTYDLYQIPHDYKYVIVHQLMFEGKMAPFYRGLTEFNPLWSDKKLLEVVCQHLVIPFKDTIPLFTKDFPGGFYMKYISSLESDIYKSFEPHTFRFRSIVSLFRRFISACRFFKCPLEVSLYRKSQECFLCFLYYPKVNYTRCCNKPICSECFVRIRHSDSCVTLDQENETKNTSISKNNNPIFCPFCLEKDFGIIYTSSVQKRNSKLFPLPFFSNGRHSNNKLQKCFSEPPYVVTTDMIRPHWLHQLINTEHKVNQDVPNGDSSNNIVASDYKREAPNLVENEQHAAPSVHQDDGYEAEYFKMQGNIMFRSVRLNLKNATYANYVNAIHEKELATGQGTDRPIITLYDGTTLSLTDFVEHKEAFDPMVISNPSLQLKS
ncbi:hypothetical protein MERGE_001953 [Pneumocystis wakefieldiae]|uniref:RING-type domain-containing protein n=1 Tax=Pneumocystis wakefieldiae TaxID=38082 RepID=A0A899FSA1_9ASCO|nr:hypothetical protein MERGE_001953 [Pneumocystis wakefieldiae]